MRPQRQKILKKAKIKVPEKNRNRSRIPMKVPKSRNSRNSLLRMNMLKAAPLRKWFPGSRIRGDRTACLIPEWKPPIWTVQETCPTMKVRSSQKNPLFPMQVTTLFPAQMKPLFPAQTKPLFPAQIRSLFRVLMRAAFQIRRKS